jgi:hypothetical protein
VRGRHGTVDELVRVWGDYGKVCRAALPGICKVLLTGQQMGAVVAAEGALQLPCTCFWQWWSRTRGGQPRRWGVPAHDRHGDGEWMRTFGSMVLLESDPLVSMGSSPPVR